MKRLTPRLKKILLVFCSVTHFAAVHSQSHRSEIENFQSRQLRHYLRSRRFRRCFESRRLRWFFFQSRRSSIAKFRSRQFGIANRKLRRFGIAKFESRCSFLKSRISTRVADNIHMTVIIAKKTKFSSKQIWGV